MPQTCFVFKTNVKPVFHNPILTSIHRLSPKHWRLAPDAHDSSVGAAGMRRLLAAAARPTDLEEFHSLAQLQHMQVCILCQ